MYETEIIPIFEYKCIDEEEEKELRDMELFFNINNERRAW